MELNSLVLPCELHNLTTVLMIQWSFLSTINTDIQGTYNKSGLLQRYRNEMDIHVAIMQTIFKCRQIIPDLQVFLGMVLHPQTVDTRLFFLFAYDLDRRL